MELDEFKSLWKKKMTEQGSSFDRAQNQKTMNTITNTVIDLHEKTLRWSKSSEAMTAMLFGVIAVAVVLAIVLPDEIDSIRNSLPAIIIFGIFGAVGTWLTNQSKKIFNTDPSLDIRTALAQTIARWKNWYVKSNILMGIILPFVSYCYLFIISQTLHFKFELVWEILISVAFTAVTMILTHLYYRKHFISKVKELKQFLMEMQ